jgi:hypothetical protein
MNVAMRSLNGVVLAGGLALAAALSPLAGAQEPGGLLLADLIRETKVALLRVQEAAEAQNLPALQDAVLEAQTAMAQDASGRVRLFVVEVGGGVATEATNMVRLKLVPPPPGSRVDVSAVELSDALAALILSAARSLDEAARGEPPLVATEVSATLRFAISRSGQGSIGLQWPGIEVGGGGSIRASELQTVVVTYALPPAR